LALQFVAFGWRINREITVSDEGRRPWLPLPDVINIASMVAVVVFCILIPLRSGQTGSAATVILGCAYVLM
jgi:hypothetical protein